MTPAGPAGGFDFAHPLKTRLLKHGVDVAHLRQGFNPRPGAGQAARANERRRQSRPAVDGMQNHAGEGHELVVQTLDAGPSPLAGLFEELVSPAEGDGRRGHHADPDRVFLVP